jgi:hypothetical protein
MFEQQPEPYLLELFSANLSPAGLSGWSPFWVVPFLGTGGPVRPVAASWLEPVGRLGSDPADYVLSSETAHA